MICSITCSLFLVYLPSEVENGDLARARLTLRELGSVVDEGYIDPILQELQK